MKIGLLGGSFNPAHGGHIYISREAIKRLGLCQVWWLVSPQNPLKSSQGMAPFDERFKGAKKLAASHPGIRVSAIERKFGTTYTYDTLRRLKARYPQHQFILLIGADNLAQLPKWRRWRDIFRLVPLAVFDRDEFFPKIMSAKAAYYFRNYRKDEHILACGHNLPAWAFVNHGKKDISATAIRGNKRS